MSSSLPLSPVLRNAIHRRLHGHALFLERLLTAVLLASILWLGWYRSRVALVWQMPLWVLLLVGLAVSLLRIAQRNLGPVFFYDLVRTARRGQQLAHRLLYAVLLLGLLFAVYWSWFPNYSPDSLLQEQAISPAERARFAGSFFTAFLGIQFAVVLFVTPTYTAGAIAEHTERRTLDYLLATDLTNREIVMGALAARLGNLLLLMITGLPVVSLLEFLGGVDPELLLASFAATIMMTLSLGGVSILISVNSRTSLGALFGTYLAMVLLLFVSAVVPGLWYANPIYALAYVASYMVQYRTDLLPSVAAFCGIHGLLAMVCCKLATSQVRRAARMHAGGPLEIPVPEDGYPIPMDDAPRSTPVIDWRPFPDGALHRSFVPSDPGFLISPRPRVSDDALYWKEVYGGRRLGPADPLSFFGYMFGVVTVVLVLTVLPFGFAAIVAEWWRHPTPLGELLQPWVRGLSIGLVCLIFIVIVLSASQRVSGERQRRTLDSLLMIPSERSAILFAKWQASILSARMFCGCLAAVWLLGSIAGAINPFALPLLVAAGMAYVALAASLGLWLSTVNKTNLRAMLSTLLAALIVLSGPGILFPFLTGTLLVDPSPSAKTHWGAWLAQYGLTPPVALWTLSFRAHDLLQDSDPRMYLRIVSALAGVQVYLLAAGVLWWLSLSGLHAEKGPAARKQGEGDKEKVVSTLLSRDGVLDRAEKTGALKGEGRAGG
jgi:ABC-type transport system involved in multi-copper enzyme maturation permease subunit